MPVRHVCFKLSLIVAFIFATASWLCAASMGRFVATGDMTIPRALHGAALLPDGKVLVAGGVSNYQYQSSAETYDPSTGTFTATGSMAEARQFCGLTNAPISLQNGKVLVTGGVNSGGVLSSAELYDETTGTFSTTGSMFIGRWCPTVTLLKDGKVLVAGGYDQNGEYQDTAEIYDPSSGTFSPNSGNMTTSRDSAMATLLHDGKVLIVGGTNSTGQLNTAEIYNPLSETFTSTGSMPAAVTWPFLGAAGLKSGKVLVTGFSSGSEAQLYDPTTATFSAAGVENFVDVGDTDIELQSGDVINVGPSGHLYITKRSKFAGGPVMIADYSTAIRLKSGEVLVCGGLDSNPYEQRAGLYIPAQASGQ